MIVETKIVEANSSLHKSYWLLFFALAVAIRALEHPLADALDFIWRLFLLGLGLASLWWMGTRKNRLTPWPWYTWLNHATLIMLLLLTADALWRAYQPDEWLMAGPHPAAGPAPSSLERVLGYDPAAPSRLPADLAAPADGLAALVGRYANTQGLVRVALQDQALAITSRAQGVDPVTLVVRPQPDGWLGGDDPDTPAFRGTAREGRDLLLRRAPGQGEGQPFAQRLPADYALPPAWRDRVGDYAASGESGAGGGTLAEALGAMNGVVRLEEAGEVLLLGDRVLQPLDPWEALALGATPDPKDPAGDLRVRVEGDGLRLPDGTLLRPLAYSATVAGAREALRQALATAPLPLLGAVLFDGEGVIWAENFSGPTAPAGGDATPLPLDTPWPLGAMSRPVAALAILNLVDRGLLDLDAPLVSHVPEFRLAEPGYRQISVRQLLAQTAGLPGEEARDASTFQPVPVFAHQVLRGLRTQRLKHAPGAMAVPCGDCYTLLERLVVAVTGTGYADFVRRELLLPLAMDHSGFGDQNPPSGPPLPLRRPDGTPWPPVYLNALAARGLQAPLEDLGRLGAMLINRGEVEGRRLLSAAAFAALVGEQAPEPPPVTGAEPGGHPGPGGDGVAPGGRPGTDGLAPGGPPGGDGVALGGLPGGDGMALGGLAAVDSLAAAGIQGWRVSEPGTGPGPAIAGTLLVAPQARLGAAVLGGASEAVIATLAEGLLSRALVERGRLAALPAPAAPAPEPPKTPGAADLAAMAGIHARHDGLLWLRPRPDQGLTLSRWEAGGWRDDPAPLYWRGAGHWAADAAPETRYRPGEVEGRHYLLASQAQGPGPGPQEVPLAQRLAPEVDGGVRTGAGANAGAAAAMAEAAPRGSAADTTATAGNMVAKAAASTATGDAPSTALGASWQRRLKTPWLAVNLDAQSTALAQGLAPVMTLTAIPELPGYLAVSIPALGVRDQVVDPRGLKNKALMTLQIPGEAGRDLNDLVFQGSPRTEWARWGGTFFRPQSRVPTLAPGTDKVTMSATGLGEWRRLPAASGGTVAFASAWYLYDPALRLLASGGDGDPLGKVPEGAYLLLYGPAYVVARVRLNLTPGPRSRPDAP